MTLTKNGVTYDIPDVDGKPDTKALERILKERFAMEKLSTIQKRNNLNEIYHDGDIGPGGAYHDYVIGLECEEGIAEIQAINFQRGARKAPDARHGILDSDLLEIVRDRLKCFQQGDFATRENACALTHIEEALMWMNKRAEDRAERNVLGTYNK